MPIRAGAGRGGRRAARQCAGAVALASKARRAGRLAGGGRQPAAAQPCALAGPRWSSSGASCATRGRGGTSTATASRPRSRAAIARAGRRGAAGDRRRPDQSVERAGWRLEGRVSGGAAAAIVETRRFAYVVQLHRAAGHHRAHRRSNAAEGMLDDGLARPDQLGIGLDVDERRGSRGRAGVGDGAADQGPLLGNRRGARYQGAGGRGGRGHRDGAWR